MIRALATLAVGLLPLAAWADRVDVRIDLSDQEMTVSLDEQPQYHWPVGSPASAGCVRLHPENARTLFDMVLENSRANTVIRIED